VTKNIRIENADNSNYIVVVEVWEAGDTDKDEDDWMVSADTVELRNPTDMITKAIWKNRYLVIREKIQ